MDDNTLPKTILNYKPEGRRNIGRTQKRWGDDFREEGTDQMGLSFIDDDDDDDDGNILQIPDALSVRSKKNKFNQR